MKILFLHKQILFPRDSGGKIRVLNLMRSLAARHEITYLCNLRPGEEKYLPEMEALGLRVEAVPARESRRGSVRYYAEVAGNLASRYPFTVARNYDPALRRRVIELIDGGGYDLVVCDCAQMARHVAGVGGPPAVLFQHNVEAQILRRHAEQSGGRLLRRYMTSQWRRMRDFEAGCGADFDAVIAVSAEDRRLFGEEYGWRHVDAIDTAVDTDFFRPRPGEELPDRVLFLGSLDWRPNQEGVRFFAREVWPAVLRERPGAVFEVVGRNPPAGVASLGGLPGVEVTGTVPDVRPHLASAAVVVVPLLVGGGTRLKIFEAMAMGKAVVSTAVGAEGLSVTPGEHYLRADAPAEFAAAVAGLLADSEARRAMGRRACEFVRDRYDHETVARQFEQICERVSSAGRGATAAADAR